jgi:hypothetical protein
MRMLLLLAHSGTRQYEIRNDPCWDCDDWLWCLMLWCAIPGRVSGPGGRGRPYSKAQAGVSPLSQPRSLHELIGGHESDFACCFD